MVFGKYRGRNMKCYTGNKNLKDIYKYNRYNLLLWKIKTYWWFIYKEMGKQNDIMKYIRYIWWYIEKNRSGCILIRCVYRDFFEGGVMLKKFEKFSYIVSKPTPHAFYIFFIDF